MPEIFHPTVVLRYRDAAEPPQYRWRLRAANGEIVGASHRGWDTPEEVELNVRDLTNELLAPINVGTLHGTDGWRWHADDAQGDTVGKSSEAFVSRRNCDENQQGLAGRLSHGYTIEDEGNFDLEGHQADFAAGVDAALAKVKRKGG